MKKVKDQKVTLDLSQLTASELKELMDTAKRNENRLLNERKDAYEAIRAEVVHRIPLERLRSLYNAFVNKTKDLKFVDQVTAEEIAYKQSVN